MAGTIIDEGLRIVDDLGLTPPEDRVLSPAEFATA
jgi:hypothetical protein